MNNATVINLLNDEETFTDVNNCQILAFEGDGSPEGIEEDLESGNYSFVATFEMDEGCLVIHIHDSSGVPVFVNDERVEG